MSFDVHTSDGSIGEVLDVKRAPGESYLIVSTGGTILSKKVLIPAGLVERVDHEGKTLHIDRSTEDIQNGPEFEEERFRTDAYRTELTDYYSR